MCGTPLRNALAVVAAPGDGILKARSAINLSGHRPDAVIWLDERDGGWVTSTAFAKTTAPFFADYIAKHPMSEQLGQTWDRALPKERYLFEYSTDWRRRTPHTTTAFPHITKGRGDEVGGAITDAWEASPYSDAYLKGRLLSDRRAQLGRTSGTEFLGISFSALDLTGHSYGPGSQEVQDSLTTSTCRSGCCWTSSIAMSARATTWWA